jgi:hypothetical protein
VQLLVARGCQHSISRRRARPLWTAGGVLTPGCENTVGTPVEKRWDVGVPSKGWENEGWRIEMEGRLGEPILSRRVGIPDEGRREDAQKLGEAVEGALDARFPGEGVRRLLPPNLPPPRTSAESRSPSDPISVSLSKSSLSTFIAAATQRSAMLVTAFLLAMSSL